MVLKKETWNPLFIRHYVGCTIVPARSRIAGVLPEFQCISVSLWKRGQGGSTLIKTLESVWMLLNITWSQNHDTKGYNPLDSS